MSDLYNKYLEILKKHQLFSKYEKQILEELNFIEQNNFFKSLDKLYKKVTNNPEKIGDKNTPNSIVSYLLGITSCPPSGIYHLEKRRTYARVGFPDIDMDFDYEKRHLIIEYLVKKYGREYVGNIGTRQTMGVKAALRRVCKALDPTNSIKFGKDGKQIKDANNASFQFENELLNTLPKKFMVKANGEKVKTVKEAYEEYPEFRKYMDLYPEVFRTACRVQGCVSGLSLHAAGMVISPVPLSEIAPLCLTQGSDDGDEEESTVGTSFTMGELESIGLLKFDVLGISTRTAVAECLKTVEKRYGSEVSSQINREHLPLNDAPTYDLLKSGRTVGTFQLESWGMRSSLKEVKVDEFYDLIALVALFRPGPKEYIPTYAKRKHGLEKVVYAHPVMEKILKSTYGIICMQEQLMQVFVDLAGMSVTDGYNFNKGCAKKKKDIINSYEDKFITGARKNGASELVANKIWNDMKAFGEYAFNLNHAAAYAYEAYVTAYLKAHYPVEFICARLAVESRRKKFDEVEVYEKDATENFGIKILPPDLNQSKETYTIVGENTIRRGFLTKGLSLAPAAEIVKHQPYAPRGGNNIFFDFATKVGTSVNTKVIETMCEVGIWKGKSKKEVVKLFEQIKKDKKTTKGRPFGQAYE